MAAKAYRSRNADRAQRPRSRFREPQIRIFDCPQCLTALFVIETSRVRHVEAACRALDQPDSDLKAAFSTKQGAQKLERSSVSGHI